LTCANDVVHVPLARSVSRVQASHEFPVRGAGRVQVLLSFLELKPQIDVLLLEQGDALL